LDGKVLLTADHTLMSDYRRNEFLGFGTCAPPNFIPDSIYRWLFFPPTETRQGLPAMAHLFKADAWPEVVRTGMGLMHDNMLVPAATLIVGSPDETEDDVIKTIDLVDDLKDIRSLIVPLFFVPLGRLKDEHWFKDAQMTKLHRGLLIRCMEHGFRWVDDLIDLAFGGNWRAKVMSPFYRLFKTIVEYKVRQAGIESKELTTRLK
jgi:hypothetical protein